MNENNKTEQALELQSKSNQLKNKTRNSRNEDEADQKCFKTKNFFQNIFEFNREKNEDTFEFKEYNYQMHPINSIIEEEDEEKDDFENSVHSYPIESKKMVQKRLPLDKVALVNKLSVNRAHLSALFSSKDRINKQQPQQEIFLQELPMTIHSKFIQPLKRFYSHEQYSSCSEPIPNFYTPPLIKSKSLSHHHLHDPNYYPRLVGPVRQNSTEEWDQNSQSSISVKTNNSASRLVDEVVRQRPLALSKSSMSYNEAIQNARRGHYTQAEMVQYHPKYASSLVHSIPQNSAHHLYYPVAGSSKTGSAISMNSRTSANSHSSNQAYYNK